MLKTGNDGIGKVFLGDDAIGKAYLGEDLVFDSSGGVPIVLPYDSEIEYLESSGTQYIDTGISLNSAFKVETKAQFTSTSGSTFPVLIGAYTSNTTYFAIPVGINEDGKLYARFGSGSLISNATPSGLHTFTTRASGSTYFDVDGTTVSSTSGVPTFSNFKQFLFARNNSGTAGNFSSAKMYYCKIWNSDNLVFDAIPVRVGQVGYMYDRVSGSLFRNEGTGSFTLGNDKGHNVVFDGSPVEYLQSSGTQCINTGIIQQSRNFEVRMRYQWTGSTSSQFETFLGYMAASPNTTPRCGFHKYQGNWMFGTNASTSTGVSVDNNVHDLFWTSNASTQKEELYLDDAKIGEGTSADTNLSSNAVPFFLGGRNRVVSADNLSSLKIMSLNFKVFSDDAHTTLTKEYNFVPYRVGQVGHLYETIGGILYRNVGSGNLTLGNDKS